MKTSKRVLSVLLVALMLLTSAPLGGVTDWFSNRASAAGGVSQKLQQVVNMFPDGSNFTVNGNCCPAGHGSACSNCYYPNVVNKRLGWGWTNMYSSYSCYGFSCFVTRYIFGTEWPRNSYVVGTANLSNTTACDNLLNQAKIGDVVSIGTSHRVIFLQKASNGMIVYDSNQGDSSGLCNKVRYWKTTTYNGMIKYYGKVNLELRRMNNYNEIDGSNARGEMTTPTISTGRNYYCVGEKVNITWAATSANTDFYQYWLIIKNTTNNTEYYGGATGSDGDVTKNSYVFTVPATGTYSITVYAVPYNSKDTRQKVATKTFYVTNNAMTTPNISLNKNSFYVGEKVNIAWTATSANTDFYQYWLIIKNTTNNTEYYGGATGSEGDATKNSYVFTIPATGTYSITVYAVPYYSKDTRQKAATKTFDVISPNPEKPMFNSISVEQSSDEVIFSWNPAKNSTCYNLFIYSISDTKNPVQSHWAIRKTSLTTNLPNGTYVARICSENETSIGNYYTDGDLSDSFTVSKANHTHSYTSKVTKSPTCTATGVKTYTCSCGDSYTETIAKTAHSYTSKTITSTYLKSGATCTSPAVYYYKCASCSAKGTATYTYGSALGHTESDWIFDGDGTKHTECTVCHAVLRTEETEECDHSEKRSEYIVTPTCTKPGKLVYICDLCDKQLGEEDVEPLGHSYVGAVTKATLSKNGAVTQTCSDCGAKKTVRTIYYPKTFAVAAQVYTGKALKPAVTVKDSAGKTVSSANYTVTYANNVAIGTATVKVTFKGNYSGTKTLTFAIVPAQVSKPKATQTTSSITLSWSKVAGSNMRYYVFSYNSSTKKYTCLGYTTGTSYTVKKLSSGTTYYYAVQAYNTTAKKWGKVSSVLTTATKPGTPTLKAVAGTRKATLSWNKQNGATGYLLYMATSKNGKYTRIATLNGSSRVSFTKMGLTKGRTYYFKVIAYKTVGSTNIYGAYSSVKYVKVK